MTPLPCELQQCTVAWRALSCMHVCPQRLSRCKSGLDVQYVLLEPNKLGPTIVKESDETLLNATSCWALASNRRTTISVCANTHARVAGKSAVFHRSNRLIRIALKGLVHTRTSQVISFRSESF